MGKFRVVACDDLEVDGAGMVDSPELAAAKRLLDVAKTDGFAFERIAPGPDGPLVGLRETVEWIDQIYLSGFWRENSCSATRRRRSSLLVPGGCHSPNNVSGDALTVLHTVLSDWAT